jgi:hypothetical protein
VRGGYILLWVRIVFDLLNSYSIDIRASPGVCQNLLGKSFVLPTSKKLCKVKKEFISNSLA